MPYEIAFSKHVSIPDREQYFNECCIGGDIVVGRLLPAIRDRYADIQTNQEDWGWFIWFRQDRVKLAIDVFTDDPEQGLFRMHLTSRKRFFLFNVVFDTRELEELQTLVKSELERWGADKINILHLNRKYMSDEET
jgi:hypothetical protein